MNFKFKGLAGKVVSGERDRDRQLGVVEGITFCVEGGYRKDVESNCIIDSDNSCNKRK